MERCVGQIWKVIVVPSTVRLSSHCNAGVHVLCGFPHYHPAYLPRKLVQTRPLPKCNVRRRLVREGSREAALPVFCRSLSLLRKPVMKLICTSYYNDVVRSIMFIKIWSNAPKVNAHFRLSYEYLWKSNSTMYFSV